MNATTASSMRQKKGLTLREKIFELHDAVRTLQNTNATNQRQVSKDRMPERTDTTSQFTALNAKVEAVEGQCGILRQAIGTMADAVSEEIEELKRGMTQEFETKLNQVGNRIDNSSLSTEKTQVEMNRMSFEIDRLREEFSSRMTTPMAQPSATVLVSPDSDHRFNSLKIETKKLFE